MAYKRPAGMGDYVWATAGNGLASARDFARLGYLMLHEGDWAGTRLFAASWLRNFTTSAAYPNIRSNVDCHWGAKYPSDMYRTTGSGQNWALVVPSLDLVVTFDGRTPATLAAQVDTASLSRLFAAVTERYVACDGTIVHDTTGISLSAAGRKRAGFEFVDLRWSGAAGTNVDVYRNGATLVTVANSGAWTDATGKKGARSLTYRLCLGGTGTCSNSVTVTF